jgi:hypothetical protein
LTTTDERSNVRLLSEGLGLVAAIMSIVGTVTNAGKQFMLTVGVLGMLAGAFIIVFWWGKLVDRTVAIGLLVSVTGSLAVGYSWAAERLAAPGSPGPSTTGSSNSPSTGTTTTTGTSPADTSGNTDATAPSPAAPPTLFSGEVRLTYGTGVDLDKNQTQGVEVGGANGDIDLYLEKYNPVKMTDVLANGGDIYPDDGPEKDAQAQCVQELKEQKKPSGFYGGNGNQYCFATSQGNTGWMRINDNSLKEGGAATDYIVLKVKVWKKAA